MRHFPTMALDELEQRCRDAAKTAIRRERASEDLLDELHRMFFRASPFRG